jgi:hypothetical protein
MGQADILRALTVVFGGNVPTSCGLGELYNSLAFAIKQSGGGSPILYQETNTDITIPSGQTTVIFDTTLDVTDISRAEIVFDCPCWEYAAAQGGNSIVNYNYGVSTPSSTVTAGQISVKGPIAWPARFTRTVNVTPYSTLAFQIAVQSVSQPVILHANPTYGAMSLYVYARDYA